jgi:hypothetical protein
MKKLFIFALSLFAALFSRAQWDPDVRLTKDYASSEISFSSQWGVAACGHFVHVVWFDNREGTYEIYYKRSTDDGISWDDDIQLTFNAAISEWPSIAVFDSLVHIVWVDNRDGKFEVYYNRSIDGGENWGTDVQLTNNSGNIRYFYPSIAASGAFVGVAWDDNRDGNMEIYYKGSTDGGINWGSETRLTTNTCASEWPSIAVSGLNVHVIWFDFRDENNEIYYKRSTDGGSNWETDTRLTYDIAVSYTGSIAVSDSDIHVVWYDDRDVNREIYYKRSTDSGSTWEWDERLTNNSAASCFPTVAACDSIVHIVWWDYRDGNAEIYYKCSTDAGSKWGTDTRLTDNYADSYRASLAVSDSIVHVVWQDSRDGNDEIYYKRNPTGGVFVGLENELLSNSGEQISIYPNPASRQLTVGRLDGWTVGQLDNWTIGQLAVNLSIVDLYGREIKEFQGISSFPYTMDISDLRNGLYFLRVTGEDGKSGSAKFLKIA